VFGRESLRDLIRNLHEENLRYQEESRHDREGREERYRRLLEETREFNREILLRNERVYTSLIAQIEEGREQIRANTKAVLSVLDRLEGSGGTAA
jgi:hypothetical protein